MHFLIHLHSLLRYPEFYIHITSIFVADEHEQSDTIVLRKQSQNLMDNNFKTSVLVIC